LCLCLKGAKKKKEELYYLSHNLRGVLPFYHSFHKPERQPSGLHVGEVGTRSIWINVPLNLSSLLWWYTIPFFPKKKFSIENQIQWEI
jgi:hypothetical protein